MTRLAAFHRYFRSQAELVDLRDLFIESIHRANADLIESFGGRR